MSNYQSPLRRKWNTFISKYDDEPKPLRKGKYFFIFIMLLLSVISWAVFYVYVNFSSIVMAFQEFMGYDENFKPVYQFGFGNFAKFIEEMSDTSTGYAQGFRDSLKNTLFFFFFGNLFSIPMQFLVSYFLYKKLPGDKLFKVTLYLPHIISTIVITTIFKNVVAANGLLSAISVTFGGEPITYLITTPEWAKWTILIYNNWIGFAGSYIIMTAAMMRVPMETLESAKLDGCGAWTEFWQLIIPMIWPTMQIFIIEKVSGILSADGPILFLTEGMYDTSTIGYWFYKQVYVSHTFEYPAAIGIIMTLFVAPIAIITRKLTDRVFADVEF